MAEEFGNCISMNPQERLSKVLKENKQRFSINKNGFISVDLNNSDVQREIERHVSKLNIATSLTRK
ncbi:multidrug ABC transporter ATPase [Pectobacterium carotovorum]|nr:multidrug ABC transporter ATPase [Pectobacterium carotovorum]ULS47535.1 multidrug ABC transporter ATPase [Pectobacterium carotovorum]